jgi:eukaryotic-like serine/threonine-protein kinase
MMLGQTISHYRILEKLGEGGMGVVFRAHDTRLDRSVALKFLAPNISHNRLEKNRFLHEARAASALDHPNICTVYEISETPDGQLFLVMPAYKGTSLDRKIEEGPIDLREAAGIAIQIAEGLRAAHDNGIIHRDIKSSNIMITDKGQVKIMDFGLAQKNGTTRNTRQDSVIGTVLYMSPEQARGDQIDRRSDLWSLGVVLYEMVTGKLPFTAEYDQAVIYRILNDEPEPVTALRPDVPPGLQTVLSGCLQKDRDKRYQSVDELLPDLGNLIEPAAPQVDGLNRRSGIRRVARPVVIIPSALLLMVLLTGIIWLTGSRPALPFAERDWVLITEFDNQTGDEIFDRALNAAFSASLCQSMYVNIFPPVRLAEVLQRMDRDAGDGINEQTGIEICLREGIRGLIMPLISRVGDNYSITVRLIDPETGLTMRSYIEAAQSRDHILPSLDVIIRKLRRDLGESLFDIRTNERALLRVTTPSLQALKHYSDGVHHWNIGNHQEATRLQQLAIGLDPDFASAHAALGIHYYSHIYNDAQRGREHFEKAVQVSDRSTDRERLFIHASYNGSIGKTREAEQLYRLLLDAYPDDLGGRSNLARILMTTGRTTQAIEQFEEILRILPDDASTMINIATAYHIKGTYTEAIAYYNQAFEAQPGFFTRANLNHEYGSALVKNGSREEARRMFNQMLDSGIRPNALRSLALLDMYEGKYTDAMIKLNDAILSNHANQNYLSEARNRLFLAALHLETADKTALLRELKTASELLAETGPQTWMLRHLGTFYARSNEIELAMAILDEVRNHTDMEIPAQRSLVLYMEGEIELAMGNAAGALQKFQISNLSKKNEFASRGIAFANYQAGDYEEAIRHYEPILEEPVFGYEAQQDWLWDHYFAARSFAELGQNNRAITLLDRFLDLWKEADEDPELLNSVSRLREIL